MNPQSFGRAAVGCHMCKAADLRLVLDLGSHPHSDSFPTAQELAHEPEVHYPLRLVSCAACGLLQIDYFVDPSRLYQKDYLYMTSVNDSGRKHYNEAAQAVCNKFSLPQGSLVVDIGSNVGVLLSGFKDKGMRVLGVDPAENIAKEALQRGIPTVADFFSYTLATQLKQEHGMAAVITGTNVFAHLHDLDDAVEGMREWLAPDGVVVIEAPHALPLIENLEYDTIYHQHIAYLSVRPMQAYFKQKGLELFDVEELPIHGGSIRYYVGHPGTHPVQQSVAELISQEEKAGIYSMDVLAAFANKVELQRQELMRLLMELKTQGKRIAVISTPAKGNTLLNYCNIDTALVDFATERNVQKIGRNTPGTHIPIYSDEELLKRKPDFALLLAWNFSSDIIRNNEEFKKGGGKFIIPIPSPQIV